MQHYGARAVEGEINSGSLIHAIKALLAGGSEGGKLAQAVVAGLMDVVAPGRVDTGKINDPSRRRPGDVCVRSVTGEFFEKAIEVKDKPITVAGIQLFGNRCLEQNAPDAAVVMTALNQPQISQQDLSEWSRRSGLMITIFYGIVELSEQAMFWSPLTKNEFAINAAETIPTRLEGIEASVASIERFMVALANEEKT